MSEGDNLAAQRQLQALVERIERLEAEKKGLTEDIGEVYGEAASNGFDKRLLRKLIAERKQDAKKRKEDEEVLDLYRAALGMFE